MRAEIDQSGKVEATSTHTVIAIANGLRASIMISGREKKKIQQIYRDIQRPRVYVSAVFAALIVLLLHKQRLPHNLIIDTEYPGHERYILRLLESLGNKAGLNLERVAIDFEQVGKKSPAHQVAYMAFRNKKADYVVSAKEVLQLLLG